MNWDRLRAKDGDWLISAPIAHRGLHDADRPENSLAAFGHAADRGIPIELDVQRTADGTLAILHDPDTSRITGTHIPVDHLTTTDLKQLKLGGSNERVPTLPQVLDLVDGRVPLLLDVRRWRTEIADDLEQDVADATRGYRGPLAAQSFDPLAVFRLRRLLPDLPIGQISGTLRSRGPLMRALGRTMATNLVTRPDFITYELSALPSRYADFWRRRGMPIIAFTVYSPAQQERAERLADNFFFNGYVPRLYEGEQNRS